MCIRDRPWTAGEEYPYCGAERADYSAVEQAAASIPTDLNNYTEKTVASLNQAIDQILYSCTLDVYKRQALCPPLSYNTYFKAFSLPPKSQV